MNISLISGQIALLHVKLETEDAFELYGGTTKAGFSIIPERPESKNEWLVTIDEPEVAGKPLTRFDIYVRQLSTGREWVVLSGKLLVSPRSAGVEADKLAPIEYNVTIPVVENAVDLTGAAIVTGIPGPRGWSAYEIAVQNGFEGTEPEWLEYMRQQTATLAVEQVTPLMERSETAAAKAENQAENAETYMHTAAAHAAAAKESELAAAEHNAAAVGEAGKAKQERETAAGHATAAAKSAQDALANQQSAEQAAQDAAQAQTGAEQAKTDADAASQTATQKATEAANSASQAAADKAAAEQAKMDAQAAQSTAEEQAAIATKAAEDAQAPESIAAQSARPATMLLVKDELMSILGDASLFNLDTDGQKIIVHTDRLSADKLAAVTDMLARFVPQFIEVEQYNHNMEISWRDINKYAACTNVADMLAVNPDYKNDLTSDGEWIYPLPNMIIFNNAFVRSAVKRFAIDLPKVTSLQKAFAEAEIEYFRSHVPNYTFVAFASTFIECKSLEIVDCDMSNITEIFRTFRNCNKLRVVTSAFPKATTMYEAFNGTQFDKESSLIILTSVPKPDNDPVRDTIQIGIHIDLQNDGEVLAAISNAEAKGWKLTVQWNGTPTSTASTMAMGSLIYAKVGEMERPDGTTEQYLDWGHYVTNWEERGYEQFRSLASAYRYFGLPEPEETLTNE